MTVFDEQISRKPNKYPWTDDFINAIHQSHWTVHEFNFRSDVAQFRAMEADEQQVIVRTLSAIGQVEVAVKRFWGQLGDNLPQPCFVDVGYVMANNETIHGTAYEHLLTVLGLEDVFEENLKEPIVRDRVNYLRKYTRQFSEDERQQYLYAIMLFTLFVENVSLFSQFYVISHRNRFGNVLKDTANQVRYTRNEETLHSKLGIKIIQTIREELPELFDQRLEDRVREEARVAFEAESRVIDWIMGDFQREKLDAELLKVYIGNKINESLVSIGYAPVIDSIDLTRLPELEWLDDETNGLNKTDFFVNRPVEYKKGGQSFDGEDLI